MNHQFGRMAAQRILKIGCIQIDHRRLDGWISQLIAQALQRRPGSPGERQFEPFIVGKTRGDASTEYASCANQ